MGRSYYEATQVLQKLINEYPESPLLADAFFQMALVYEAQEMYTEAAQAYSEYLQLRPGTIDAYVYDRRAQAHFAIAEYSASATDFQAALQAPSMLDQNFLRLKLARAYSHVRRSSNRPGAV
jgi:tetratricopeptide (TPR) repeat protein